MGLDFSVPFYRSQAEPNGPKVQIKPNRGSRRGSSSKGRNWPGSRKEQIQVAGSHPSTVSQNLSTIIPVFGQAGGFIAEMPLADLLELKRQRPSCISYETRTNKNGQSRIKAARINGAVVATLSGMLMGGNKQAVLTSLGDGHNAWELVNDRTSDAYKRRAAAARRN